jgi:hypothetical protein
MAVAYFLNINQHPPEEADKNNENSEKTKFE